jgi:uncharacterized protein (DUF3820 family)
MDETILAKVKARNEASVVFGLAAGEAEQIVDDGARVAFWRALLGAICDVLPSEEQPTRVVEKGSMAAMTNEEAKAFEAELMPFGKWANKLVCEVPLDYLDWLDGQRDFRKQLNRYLRNKQVMAMEREATG